MNKHSKQQNKKKDLILFGTVIFLVLIGIIMVYSASSTLTAQDNSNQAYNFFINQIKHSVAGFILMLFCMCVPYTVFTKKYIAIFLIFLAVLLLSLLFTQAGSESGGALRWLKVSCFTFQPSEFLKFSIIIYLGYSLNKKLPQIKNFYIGSLPHFILFCIFAVLLYMQPDFGSILILFAIISTIMFAGGVPVLHICFPIIVLGPIVAGLMYVKQYPVKRIFTIFDPWAHELDGAYQLTHSLMAFGTGGLFGTGPGQSFQKLFYLPEPHTDFILSVIGEEFGLIGVFIIISLYLVILWKGIFIALNAKNREGAIVAVGITITISLQVCINMGVALGLLPTTGLTLPFLSYGGSSLVINMMLLGILINIGSVRN